MPRIVLLSDTHGLHRSLKVPDGDILIHAGDMSSNGKRSGIEDFADWMKSLPHRHKLCVAGNRDFYFQNSPEDASHLLTDAGIHYLCDTAVTVEDLKVYGSPWNPWFHDWAFNLPRGDALARIWAKIPEDTDILVTHTPPFGILDTALSVHLGCEALAERILQLPKLKLHAFGHIHEGYGTTSRGTTLFVNASFCDRQNPPLLVTIS